MGDRNKNYVISVKGGGKNREITLSSGMFKFGVVSAVVSALLFVGACGYSVYSALYKQKNADSVVEVQKANEIQQEQLLKISKKADEMSDTLHNLARQEEELRIQAGLKPPKEDPLEIEGKYFEPKQKNLQLKISTTDRAGQSPNLTLRTLRRLWT